MRKCIATGDRIPAVLSASSRCKTRMPTGVVASALRAKTFERPYTVRDLQHIAFYTVFCGTGDNVANKVHDPPSSTAPSYYFTDNSATFAEASRKGWRAKMLGGQPSSDLIGANMKAKDSKARPHNNPLLAKFRYTVYHDSKEKVQGHLVIAMTKSVLHDKAIAIREHNFILPPVSVWTEFDESMKQERYSRQRDASLHQQETPRRVCGYDAGSFLV